MRGASYSPHHRSLAKFDRRFSNSNERFTHIGSGELGGKAHGLARVHGLLEAKLKEHRIKATTIEVKEGDVVVTDAIVSADAQKATPGAPPGAAPAGGGMRRVF